MVDKEIKVGLVNKLKVDRITEVGIYVEDEFKNAILLPNRYVTKNMKVGDELDVFVYRDSEDRLVAITDRPIAQLYEFGLFEVVDTTKFGAFVNWGLEKDLFVPKRFQKTPFRVGENRILKIILDKDTDRLIATEKYMEYINRDTSKLRKFSEVNIFVFGESPLGFKVIVNNRYEGLVFRAETFLPIKIGDNLKAFIKNIRSDGKLDISLTQVGGKSDGDSGNIMKKLKANGGKLPYNYKSEAESIVSFFGVSKKSFKASLTKLKEKGLIDINDDGIELKK